MRVIIAGGRDFTDKPRMINFIDSLVDNNQLPSRFEIVSGMAKGADCVGLALAKEYGLLVHEFPADWIKHGKPAGMIRNVDMANNADALIVAWDGKSRGTAHMIQTMQRMGKPVFILRY